MSFTKNYFDHMYRRDGYRYIRQQQYGPHMNAAGRYLMGCERPNHYALFEIRGGKKKRVGTAKDYEEAMEFCRQSPLRAPADNGDGGK